jgi:hypothetical protein
MKWKENSIKVFILHNSNLLLLYLFRRKVAVTAD